MTPRRRHWLRDENVAPWVTLVVVLGLWWVGARMFGPESIESAPARTPRPPAARTTTTPSTSTIDGPARAVLIAPGQEAAIEPITRADVNELRERDLLMPVKGVSPKDLRPTYDDKRGAARTHEALDILAPRGTEVRAAGDGRIAKLFTSERGGLTIYQFDEDGRFCFYYAHLDRYADDVREGDEIDRGDTLGYVGTTGNAPPNTPHLHFAIFKLGADKHWWQGAPIDPYLVLR